ncbi:DHA1 family bicyclomycin/chloramphenicol resistance-like MFS transporter [Rhizobium sp. BK196]|jgi:MFS transporter, DHA1 family, multidrug resistance protein|uniref:multidrug effflux MFS transporter n=1 Tax=unclassified Rhizobium TaxID=2613769 RepID=UPI00160986DC|nr:MULTISPECIES: multidrug effflux MFS transporter [unclassified Rhizobium]MBB3311948.1 DHA1 family bicyclomycin/chloramphenicol resistance-like MFS transporter [Rhizobium sp. BK196]MBB3464705.1 DHA1 family bicyclomycin/chloramphenicol resistance-like MFS transporter [Rhizobium sp. BK377]
MTPTHKPHTENQGSARIGMGFVEFVVTIAIMTASIAMAIDSMLPALPNIGHSLGVTSNNDAQLVIGVFFLGFGASQIIFGSLSDAFGRRNILLGGLVCYVIGMFAAAATGSFEMLLIMRFVQGIGGAAVRITTMAIVRDCFGGREMARVMSYVMIVFMIVPIVAPSVGQLIITYANWHWIFILLGIIASILFVWALLRLKESLPPEERIPLSFDAVADGFKTVLTNRITCGYMIGLTMFTGVISAYVISVQQVFGEVYGLGDWLPIAFAATAGGIAVANFANGMLVRTFGMRRISHAAMLLFTIISSIGLVAALGGTPSFAFSYALFSILLIMFAVIATNFTAISLEPMGNLAGTATAITGFVSTTFGALLGGGVGQLFNGTVQPLFGGFTLFGAVTVLMVLWAEKGKLFTHPGDSPQIDPGAVHM